MKRVKEQSKYMVGLVILFVVTGLTLLLAGVFMLYLVAYIKILVIAGMIILIAITTTKKG